MKDYSRSDRETVESIAVGLTTCKSTSELARNIGVDVSGLIKRIKILGFRHFCVSYLLSQGMSYRTVARWVGDTEEVVLQAYSHLIPDEKDQIGKIPKWGLTPALREHLCDFSGHSLTEPTHGLPRSCHSWQFPW